MSPDFATFFSKPIPSRSRGIATLLKRKRGKLYVAFVDFKTCFDTIDRTLLWHILKENGIKGNLFIALQSMCKSVKSYMAILAKAAEKKVCKLQFCVK